MSGWDYIIVGAGSAGCVLADKLSRNPAHRVLLLEAGREDNSLFIHLPKGVGKLYGTDKYLATVDTVVPEGAPPETWLRGRVLGGSSSVNGMMYFRGQPRDYDAWEAMGAHGWGWKEMARVFAQVEDHELGGGEGRGSGGPLGIAISPHRSELTEAMIAAGEQMGLKRVKDLNQPDQSGVGYASWTIRNGRRCSAAKAFLAPARKRPNLHVETQFSVDRVLFDGTRAVGVIGKQNGQVKEHRTEGEVILSGGGLFSPQLLQRSGIGDPAHLASLGIEVVAASPGVGRNLLEHRLLTMSYKLTRPISNNASYRGIGLAANVVRYFLTGKGRLAEGTYDIGAFAPTRPGETIPDAEILMATYAIDQKRNFNTRLDHSFHMFGYPLRSLSQGTIMIQSADPGVPPVAHANYLSDPYDREVTIAMFHYMRRWVQQPAMAPLIGEEILPGPHIQSDEDIVQAFIRDGASGSHACGTCAMGDGPEAVVDEKCRVRGVSRLRVVDGSILPTMPSSNTNGPIIATGWRASELILEGRNA